MKVLIACEFSGIVREEFRKLGHEAWSCDLLPTEIPGNHYQGDIFEFLNKDSNWDLMIAHPPCTDLTSAGAVYWEEKQRNGSQGIAIDFVKRLFSFPISKIALENPVGILSTKWIKPSQIIQPFQFGDPFLKRTCLWLKNLDVLTPTNIVKPVAHWHSGATRGGKKKDGTRTKSLLPALKRSSKDRSRTFPGIAKAMAEQWSNYD